jgi:hypothetical protein
VSAQRTDVPEENENKKPTNNSYHRDKKKFHSFRAWEKAASKSTSWRGKKRYQVLQPLKYKI